MMAGFGVYIHWPFCLAKCPYCDFNSHVARDIDQGRWRRALIAELDRDAERLGPRKVDSIFFGGGTPSLMAPDTVARLIDRVRDHWNLAEDVEITLEANPTSVEAGRFRDFAAAGVNRLSLGIQALNDDDLKTLGRAHDRATAIAALELGQRSFERVSFDLIYARSGRDPDHWLAELSEALGFGTDHLSLYQLTVEPGTPFHADRRNGRLVLPDDDQAASLYEATQLACAATGLPAYEISNHAAAGQACRHNLVYWRSGEYVGIGPGAHGRFAEAGRRIATSRIRPPNSWLAAVERDGSGSDAETVLDATTIAEEAVMMGLRLTDGIGVADVEALTGQSLSHHVDQEAWTDLVTAGLLAADPNRLVATEQGRLVLNHVLGKLLL